MAKKKIEVPALDLKRMVITLVGDTPLICNRFSEKKKKEMLAKQQRQAKQGRDVRDPESEFEDALYRIPGIDGAYGFPVMGFKNATTRAAKSMNIHMTDARGFFRIQADMNHLLIPLRYTNIEMGNDKVRIARGTTDLRYRPYFYGWEVDLEIIYNASVVSEEQIVMMFDIAGFSVGVGDWRPEHNGINGCFHVKKGNE